MLVVPLLLASLGGVGAAFSPSLEALFREHRGEGSGDPFVSLQAEADLNADGVPDAVVIFSYQIGPSMDKSHPHYLTVVLSSPDGYAASQPVLVGIAGTRYIKRMEIFGSKVVLYADVMTWDGTASMAYLPAAAEIVYEYRDGKLLERSGTWTRKPD
jgi:hypothetical protein